MADSGNKPVVIRKPDDRDQNCVHSVVTTVRTNLQSGLQSVITNLKSGFNDARRNLKEGFHSARTNVQVGVQDARTNIAKGVESARLNINKELESARKGINTGLIKARDNISPTLTETITRPAEYTEENAISQPAISTHVNHATNEPEYDTLEEMTSRLERQIEERRLRNRFQGSQAGSQETGIIN
jgi:phage-related protein